MLRVECGTDDRAAERTEGPAQAGMREDVEGEEHRPDARRNRCRDAEDVEREELRRHAPRDLENVEAERRHRAEVRIGVMDAVDAPQERPRVGGAVDPVGEGVEYDQRDDAADGKREVHEHGCDTAPQRFRDDRHEAAHRRPENESVDAARIKKKIDGIRAHADRVHSRR